MSDLERRDQEEGVEKSSGDSVAPYTTTAVGIGLIVAAVLVVMTAGVAAAGLPFVVGAAACLGYGIPKIMQQRRGEVSAPPDTERELLSAIRNNGGSITPAEAAMETTLTVREADGMLSELAGSGHLAVESHHGALVYSLPGRRAPEIG